MAFEVKATLVGFLGDEEHFPCHFLYKVGDSFTYDGEEFHGRICAGLIQPMLPVIQAVRNAGMRYSENIEYRYSGLSAVDPSMAKYDGLGFRPLKEVPEGALPRHVQALAVKPAERRTRAGWTFVCNDARTSALFVVEPTDISRRGHDMPHYKRSMAMLEKINAEPGITLDDILEKFTEWDRNEVYPPLTRAVAECLLDQMEQVNYLEIRGGKYYPRERAMGTKTAAS